MWRFKKKLFGQVEVQVELCFLTKYSARTIWALF